MPFRRSLHFAQEDFARAIAGATGHEALLEHRAYDVVGIGSPQGAIRWISPSVQDFLGWRPDELIGVGANQLIHPADIEHVAANRELAKVGGRPHQELRIRCRNGRFRWFSTDAAALTGPDGETTGIIGGWRCIDEEMARREAALAVGRRLRSLIDSMSDPYVALKAIRGADGRARYFEFIDGNAAAASMLGLEVDQLPGASLARTVPEHLFSRLVVRLRQALEGGLTVATHGRPGELLAQQPGTYWDLIVDPVDADTVAVRWMEATSRVVRHRLEAAKAVDESIEAERHRIAADLHDGFVQQVMYTGMTVSALLPDMSPSTQRLLQRVVEVQDDMIRQLRATILALSHTDLGTTPPSVAVGRIAREATMHLGLDVHHEVLGQLDEIDDVSVLRHLLLALRELLLNVVRHAEATVVNVRVELADRNLHLTVTDNGKGPGDTANPGHGLQNLSDRARRLGGDFTLQHGEPHGSVAAWRVPLLTAD